MNKAIRFRTKKSPKELTEEEKDRLEVKDFFDLAAPSTIKFQIDHYIFGNTYRTVWAIVDYPRRTTAQAILARLAETEGCTLHLYSREMSTAEQRKLFQHAIRANSVNSNAAGDIMDAAAAEGNIDDIAALVKSGRITGDSCLHMAVYLELCAKTLDALNRLKDAVEIELAREKLTVDKLLLRQKEGFQCVMPAGKNALGELQERILPSLSAGNLFPFSYSGKTDPNGMYLGKDKFGSSIIVDFDRRSDDKTNSGILILGNSGQGKSYLMKLILTNLRMSGKTILCLDPEAEYEALTEGLGGCYLDLMDGVYRINPLEPRLWTEQSEQDEPGSCPEAFRKSARLSQHISYLKDFFRSYKDFSDAHIDIIEILLTRLYTKFGITDSTDFTGLKPSDYPLLSDLYALAEEEYNLYEAGKKSLFSESELREICLGLNSLCVGAESRFFNGPTNITDNDFLCFGVKGLLEANERLRNIRHSIFRLTQWRMPSPYPIRAQTNTTDQRSG